LFSAFRSFGIAVLMITALPATAGELRVCADPDNLPFSSSAGEGFENKIMTVVAAELGDQLSYVWWPQRGGRVTEALNGGLCDVVPGIGRVDGVLLTYPPYYRSTYAFVTRSPGRPVSSFDDATLRKDLIGVQLVGDDGANPPPAVALARRGIVDNVRGFSVFDGSASEGGTSSIMAAVARGDIDVAIAWGPVAGYFARRSAVPLTVTPAAAQIDPPDLPMAFDVSMGLRLDEGPLRKDIEAAIARRKADIDGILVAYDVPRLDHMASP
jgi:mxaJ protein